MPVWRMPPMMSNTTVIYLQGRRRSLIDYVLLSLSNAQADRASSLVRHNLFFNYKIYWTVSGRRFQPT